METKEIPVCPLCKRKTIYFRKDGSVKCRACSYDGPADIGENKMGGIAKTSLVMVREEIAVKEKSLSKEIKDLKHKEQIKGEKK